MGFCECLNDRTQIICMFKKCNLNNYPKHKYRNVYILICNTIEHRLLMCRENSSIHLSEL